jgi:hypothetical protein
MLVGGGYSHLPAREADSADRRKLRTILESARGDRTPFLGLVAARGPGFPLV